MIIRLIFGDQLNAKHSWFSAINPNVLYVMMEVRQETDYAPHHIQKVLGIFLAMRTFAQQLTALGHNLKYFKLDDNDNQQSVTTNLHQLLLQKKATQFHYLIPDEYRVATYMQSFCISLSIPTEVLSTEHFMSEPKEFADLFEGKKTFIMDSFYRFMRRKHDILIENNKPLFGKWSFDGDNRKKLPKNTPIPAPLLFHKDVSDLVKLISNHGVKTIGTVAADNFIWPTSNDEAQQLLDYFCKNLLVHFGTYQDAMAVNQWSIFHSRLSFAMNLKLISPHQVIHQAVQHWKINQSTIDYHQIEGFVRQILGWREYMRGLYWTQMPAFASLNFFEHQNPLPQWFWSGETKMTCLSQSIKQSLTYSYAHHIQRLMVTGNFALLAGVHPDEVDQWYLGIYIDAFEWVEITNTRGMSQYADGGLTGTKPYISSASYIDKMSDYCSNCYYDKKEKIGSKACPFNSLYWNFIDNHRAKLSSNPRMTMMYAVWDKMDANTQSAILTKAQIYLSKIDEL